MNLLLKNATDDGALVLYRELTRAQSRTIQRYLKANKLKRIVPGMVSNRPPEEWPALIAQERTRVLAALFPGAVFGYRSAFKGGVPVDGVVHLSYSYSRIETLPGLTIVLVKAAGRTDGDMPISGRDIYFPSNARLLMENLTINRAKIRKTVSPQDVENRLLTIFEARGEHSLRLLLQEARDLAPTLGLTREFAILEGLIGSVLGTWSKNQLSTQAGKAWASGLPYDRARIELLENFAAALRTTPLQHEPAVTHTAEASKHFAFLESYFSNFIEGTEFDIAEARAFVLEGKPIETRPKDSHDVLGVFKQILHPGWAHQTLSAGEPVLEQLRARHADMMRERPEVAPGEFKDRENFAGNTSFVVPRHVRGTLVAGSKLLPNVPSGMARALFAMFLISEVHPFIDGNGRLARLAMNAELSAAGECRIVVPTLFREEYLDCLRVLTRAGNPAPILAAMQLIHRWTAAFKYEDLDRVIADMKGCNAFEKSRSQHQLLFPSGNGTTPLGNPD